MATITKLKARQVLDSRGNPTVEAEVWSGSNFARAIVPSGASTGSNEALELRDKGKEFMGKSVFKAVSNVNKQIASRLDGMEVHLSDVDKAMIELDGTETKSNLGANAIVAVSMATARLEAQLNNEPLYKYLNDISGHRQLTLPVPQMNVINGGAHGGNNLDIQEHHIIPSGANDFSEAVQMGVEIYHTLKGLLKKKYGPTAVNVGDEGGFAPPMNAVEEPIEMIKKAIKDAGYENKVKIGLDSAASEFFDKGKYKMEGHKLSSAQTISVYKMLCKKYPIITLEDALAESDWSAWSELTKELGSSVQIIGDDLLTTNPKLIRRAVSEKACNSLLLKVNQIGSITESIEAANLAFDAGWKVVVSHRSGESEDPFIADLVVGLGAEMSKFGAPARTDRNAKYNQLLRIEEELKESGQAVYQGRLLKL